MRPFHAVKNQSVERCSERIAEQTVEQYVQGWRPIPQEVAEIVELPVPQIQERRHHRTVQQMDDILVQHVPKCTMEEISEVRLIVQVDKVMPRS